MTTLEQQYVDMGLTLDENDGICHISEDGRKALCGHVFKYPEGVHHDDRSNPRVCSACGKVKCPDCDAAMYYALG